MCIKRRYVDKEYAMYKGKECIAIGTIKEIADKLGKTYENVYWHSTQAARKRAESRKHKWKKGYLAMVCLEDDEE